MAGLGAGDRAEGLLAGRVGGWRRGWGLAGRKGRPCPLLQLPGSGETAATFHPNSALLEKTRITSASE